MSGQLVMLIARSVAKMLQEELCPPDPNDPTYVGIKSPIEPTGQFFINPSTLTVRRCPEQYTRSRRGASGILAEDPGAGKTIMVRLKFVSSYYALNIIHIDLSPHSCD